MYELLDTGAPGGGAVDPARAVAGVDMSGGAVLLCSACRNVVTCSAFMTAIEGNTRHTFTNPHGYTFTFTTFALAPGCRAAGEPTREHTWFPPHAWQLALCSGCGVHLGWRFEGTDPDAFHGLIEDRLTEEYLQ